MINDETFRYQDLCLIESKLINIDESSSKLNEAPSDGFCGIDALKKMHV